MTHLLYKVAGSIRNSSNTHYTYGLGFTIYTQGYTRQRKHHTDASIYPLVYWLANGIFGSSTDTMEATHTSADDLFLNIPFTQNCEQERHGIDNRHRQAQLCKGYAGFS